MLPLSLLQAWRQMGKHKISTAINVLSLTIGIAAALVIYLIVRHEFKYESFVPDKERVFRVVSRLSFPGQVIENSGVPAPFPFSIRAESTSFDFVAPLHYWSAADVSIKAGDNNLLKFRKQKLVAFTDASYFHIIPYQWIAGSPEQSLSNPYQAVLSKSNASQYFPGVASADIIGREIIFNDSIRVTISGIVKDLEEVTDFNFKSFISLATLSASNLKNNLGWEEWGSVSSSSIALVKLKDNITVAKGNKELASILKKHSSTSAMQIAPQLQEVTDIHFNNKYDNFEQRHASKSTLYGLVALAFFLLLLGAFNFVNLHTAQSVDRAREIGIRKTLGSSQGQLVNMVLFETWLLTLIAALLSLVLTPIVMRLFSEYIPADVQASGFLHPEVFIFILGLTIVVSLLAGFYPAKALSAYRAIAALQNAQVGTTGMNRKTWVRKALTVSQFAISLFLVIGVIVVSQQLNYSVNKQMGFRRDGIFYFNTPWQEEDASKRAFLLNELKKLNGVEAVSLAGAPPAANGWSSTTMKYTDGKQTVETTTDVKSADSSYYSVYDLKVVAGKIPASTAGDNIQYVVNEAFLSVVGIQNPNAAIGKFIDRGDKRIPIAAVVKDFHFKSMHTAIEDLAFSNEQSNFATYHVKLAQNNASGEAWKNTLGQVESLYKKTYPAYDYSYQFIDDTITAFYTEEKMLAGLLRWAGGLSILISCMGLFGLAIYTTKSRTREIGVRKVLGASVTQLVALLSQDVVLLVALAFGIAAPLAYWAASTFLNGFAYKTPVHWWVFVAAFSGMLVTALSVVCMRTIKAARANPVNSIRTQ